MNLECPESNSLESSLVLLASYGPTPYLTNQFVTPRQTVWNVQTEHWILANQKAINTAREHLKSLTEVPTSL